MAYNKKFSLNPSDIDVIETCLRNELHARSEKYHGTVNQEETGEDDPKQHVSEITDLLGKIHNQKIWFQGDPAKPTVPKG